MAIRTKMNLFSGTRASRTTGVGIAVALGFLVVSIIAAAYFWNCLSAGESVGSTLRNVAVIVAGLVALPLAIARVLVVGDQADTADRSLANDRYQRGAEMLGHEDETVRIGGIDALREVAHQYPHQYVRPAMRLLCRILCTHIANAGGKPDFRTRSDLPAAIEAIGSFGPNQRGTCHDPENRHSVDLSNVTFTHATLSGLNLAGLNFRNSRFIRTDLRGVDFSGADLRGSSFDVVDMCDAKLNGALISGARFCPNVGGMTQEQLDSATADENDPPAVGSTQDYQTGALLVYKTERLTKN